MIVDVSRKYQIVYNGKEQEVALGDILKNYQKTILYFYPKDNTPWCTIEAVDFTWLKDAFLENWIQIIWVSQDSVESHKKFIHSESLGIHLVSDSEWILHKEFWVIWEKNMYGRISIGVIRSTFLLDTEWNVLKEWKNVKATGHVEKIYKELILK